MTDRSLNKQPDFLMWFSQKHCNPTPADKEIKSKLILYKSSCSPTAMCVRDRAACEKAQQQDEHRKEEEKKKTKEKKRSSQQQPARLHDDQQHTSSPHRA
jgi:hypothetical protein